MCLLFGKYAATNVDGVKSTICHTYETVCNILAVPENSALPFGWDSSYERLKLTAVVYKYHFVAKTKNFEGRSELDTMKVNKK